MEPTKPKIPAEAVALYNVFIHGGMSRRAFMDGIKKIAVGTMAASAMVEALMPQYAAAQQVSPTDNRIKASYETVPSPNGNGTIKGYFVRPMSADTRSEKPSKLPGIIVIHENRGLNPHIEDIARRFALANFMAFAPDGLTSLRLPRRRLQGWPPVLEGRRQEDGRRYGRIRPVAQGSRRLHRQDRRHRLLLRRQHVEYARRPAWR